MGLIPAFGGVELHHEQGKPFKLAIIVTARKRLAILNAMFKYQTGYASA